MIWHSPLDDSLVANEEQDDAIGTEDKDNPQTLSTDGKEDTQFKNSIHN